MSSQLSNTGFQLALDKAFDSAMTLGGLAPGLIGFSLSQILNTAGAGSVTGPVSSVDGQVALFSGTSGSVIEALTGNGAVMVTGGVATATLTPTLTGLTLSGATNTLVFSNTSGAVITSALPDSGGTGWTFNTLNTLGVSSRLLSFQNNGNELLYLLGNGVMICNTDFRSPTVKADQLYSLFSPNITIFSPLQLGNSGPTIQPGTGTPNGTLSAPVASLYLRTDGSTGSSLYVKETGTGNTGWTAVGGGGSSAAYMVWDGFVNSSTTPSVGTLTTFAETGIIAPVYSVNTTQGNALSITQTSGDVSSGHVHGFLSNVPSSSNYTVQARFRVNGSSLTSTGNRFGIGACASVASNIFSGYQLILLSDGGSNATIYFVKDVAGSVTVFNNNPLTTILPVIAVNDSLLFQLDVYGSWISASLNGILLHRVFDTSLSAHAAAIFAEPVTAGNTQVLALCDYFAAIPHTNP